MNAVSAAPDAADWGGDHARALLDLVVVAESRDDDPESALRALLARSRSHLAARADSEQDPAEESSVTDPGRTA